ncbi:MAG: hypothetical protein Q6363_008005 [Candidatus Njordarchaeota archaeon]
MIKYFEKIEYIVQRIKGLEFKKIMFERGDIFKVCIDDRKFLFDFSKVRNELESKYGSFMAQIVLRSIFDILDALENTVIETFLNKAKEQFVIPEMIHNLRDPEVAIVISKIGNKFYMYTEIAYDCEWWDEIWGSVCTKEIRDIVEIGYKIGNRTTLFPPRPPKDVKKIRKKIENEEEERILRFPLSI